MKRFEAPDNVESSDEDVLVQTCIREGDTVEHHYHPLVATVSPITA